MKRLSRYKLHNPPSQTQRVRRLAHTPWLWASTGAVLGVLIATLVWAPAHWLTHWIQGMSQQRLQFHGVRGSVWQGSAQLSLASGAHAQNTSTLPGKLSWQISPSRAGLHIQVQADCCMEAPWVLDFQPRWNSYQLHLADNTAQLPAAWLVGLGTPWNTIQPEGHIVISSQNLSWHMAASRPTLGGQLQIDALALSSRLSSLRPTGSYRITIAGGSTPNVTLQTLSGALLLSGQGQWVGGRLHFAGEASAQAQSSEALSNLLNILGRRDGARTLLKLG